MMIDINFENHKYVDLIFLNDFAKKGLGSVRYTYNCDLDVRVGHIVTVETVNGFRLAKVVRVFKESAVKPVNWVINVVSVSGVKTSRAKRAATKVLYKGSSNCLSLIEYFQQFCDAQVEDSHTLCPSCRTRFVSISDKFCPACGNKVDHE